MVVSKVRQIWYGRRCMSNFEAIPSKQEVYNCHSDTSAISFFVADKYLKNKSVHYTKELHSVFPETKLVSQYRER